MILQKSKKEIDNFIITMNNVESTLKILSNSQETDSAIKILTELVSVTELLVEILEQRKEETFTA
jgi:hypothetical protein|tara:strand:- start:3371 stop:3565 length:195 start_codon:yes stop_codon:yes gene_type:complete